MFVSLAVATALAGKHQTTSNAVMHIAPGMTATCLVSDFRSRKTWYADGRPYPKFEDAGLSKMLSSFEKRGQSFGSKAVIVKLETTRADHLELRIEPVANPNASALKMSGGHGTSWSAVFVVPGRAPASESFRFGYAGATWQRIANYAAGRHGMKLGGLVTDLRQDAFSVTGEQKDSYVRVVTNLPNGIDPKSVRMVAVDRAGHNFISDNGYFGQGEYKLGPELSFPGDMTHIGLKVRDITRLFVESRAEHWVTFRNVRLRP